MIATSPGWARRRRFLVRRSTRARPVTGRARRDRRRRRPLDFDVDVGVLSVDLSPAWIGAGKPAGIRSPRRVANGPAPRRTGGASGGASGLGGRPDPTTLARGLLQQLSSVGRGRVAVP